MKDITNHFQDILIYEKERIILTLVADDERHCCVLTEHTIFIVDFISNKLKAKYHNPVKMTLMSFSKDLSEL